MLRKISIVLVIVSSSLYWSTTIVNSQVSEHPSTLSSPIPKIYPPESKAPNPVQPPISLPSLQPAPTSNPVSTSSQIPDQVLAALEGSHRPWTIDQIYFSNGEYCIDLSPSEFFCYSMQTDTFSQSDDFYHK